MDNYETVLHSFIDIGFNESSTLDEQEASNALDEIYQRKINSKQLFNRDVAQEIFEQTKKNEKQEVRLKDFISTILEAYILLSKYIQEHNQQIEEETNEHKRAELTTHLKQYQEDYDLIAKCFGIRRILKKPSILLESRLSNSSHMNEIFVDTPKEKSESTSLKITFIIALGCFVLEFFLMFEKHHFLSMLAYVAVLSIFLLNYFDRDYIIVTLYILVSSIFLDFMWVILQADHYWNINGASQHSNSQQGFFRFIYIMNLISMLAKAAIAYLLSPYRSNYPERCQAVRLFNFRFQLSAAGGSPLKDLTKRW